MAKQELDVQLMSLADLRVLAEISGNLAEYFKKVGLKEKADRWEYNRSICINALEYRADCYFKE
ncbi:hypothetical protein [Sinomicrobium weinanense]|uniref:Uncharacterized protein n=1 Tax=Sinomicrobium weinanense TaxID=2842200 RepID=A0A926Q382_9FLAO|nr:hypothetical protein [Sinomicrobium weinanense]MBC9795731.1 hypothetical protein [Sinomicrobium weinanense]MBU3125294.1 hypothetical protein [Sinomicrobium weinanense]